MHYCPECEQACYCHGDIDDAVVEDDAYSSQLCTHPLQPDCAGDDGPELYGPELDESVYDTP